MIKEENWFKISSFVNICQYVRTVRHLTEFIPYVFQIMSILLEIHTDQVPEMYMLLLPFLLAPVLWERPGNIPPLVRLLQAFIEKGAAQIPDDKIVRSSGIFGSY